jgi:hypothetical protein
LLANNLLACLSADFHTASLSLCIEKSFSMRSREQQPMQQLDKLLRSLAMSLKSRPSPLKKPLAPPDLQPKKEKFISRQKGSPTI